MILNLLRVETLKVEEMIKRSFSENASQQLRPDQQKEIHEVCSGVLDSPMSSSAYLARAIPINIAQTRV